MIGGSRAKIIADIQTYWQILAPLVMNIVNHQNHLQWFFNGFERLIFSKKRAIATFELDYYFMLHLALLNFTKNTEILENIIL